MWPKCGTSQGGQTTYVGHAAPDAVTPVAAARANPQPQMPRRELKMFRREPKTLHHRPKVPRRNPKMLRHQLTLADARKKLTQSGRVPPLTYMLAKSLRTRSLRLPQFAPILQWEPFWWVSPCRVQTEPTNPLLKCRGNCRSYAWPYQRACIEKDSPRSEDARLYESRGSPRSGPKTRGCNPSPPSVNMTACVFSHV